MISDISKICLKVSFLCSFKGLDWCWHQSFEGHLLHSSPSVLFTVFLWAFIPASAVAEFIASSGALALGRLMAAPGAQFVFLLFDRALVRNATAVAVALAKALALAVAFSQTLALTVVDARVGTLGSQGLVVVAVFWDVIIWECWVNLHKLCVVVHGRDTFSSLYSELDKAILAIISAPRVLDDPVVLAFF